MNDSQVKCKPTREDESEAKPEGFPGATLLGLLRSRRGCGLSDPRDMVYAHLGLVSHETWEVFPIDYDKSVAQVYQDIAISYVKGSSLIFATTNSTIWQSSTAVQSCACPNSHEPAMYGWLHHVLL